jgi:arylsulfatase A-like enzyme
MSSDGDRNDRPTLSRRRLLSWLPASVAGASSILAASYGSANPAAAAKPRLQRGPDSRPLNILFIFTDQERYFRQLPPGLSLPGHERLWRTGTTFTNHYVGAVMCSSSRAIILTGLQTPDNGMFENADMRWVPDLSTNIPTIGHMLRKAGYYTAYKGKWHLTKSFDQQTADRLFTKEMEAYGFADYASPGDVVGHTLGGYEFDHLIAGSAITWLRRVGGDVNAAGKPWCLTVSLVNPHDVMYFDTDAPGTAVQNNGRLLKRVARAPNTPFYEPVWDQPLPPTRLEDLHAVGRPRAHAEYQTAWAYVLGQVPNETDRWMRYNNFYLNSLRAVDAQVTNILNELDTLGLTERTIIVFTADHGEMGGAHGGLCGKGPFAYEEAIHVPMVVVHPDVQGGRQSRALTAAIDIAPSFLAMAGAGNERTADVAGRPLPGKNIAPLLGNPSAGPNANREAVLFTYSGVATNDSDMVRTASEAIASGKGTAAIAASGAKPDLKKRGSVRSMFDGRYKFTRYFAPIERNRPTSLEELYAHNDVELFDLQPDPDEADNLAATKGANSALVLESSAKLERVIAAEIGRDDGREMPDIQGKEIAWVLQEDPLD